MTIAERILVLINKKTWGVKKVFAAKAGIPPATLSRYLSGKPPSRDNAGKIARAGDVSIDWVLDEAGNSSDRVGEKSSAYEMSRRTRRMQQIFNDLLRSGDMETLDLIDHILKAWKRRRK